MSSIDPKLLDQLVVLRGHAYAPYSDHPVAAVVESRSGRHFGGSNVEVAHFKGLCAEAAAISAMVAAGEREIVRVHVLGPAGRPCPPCGDCRQRIREFSDAGTEVILIDETGRLLKRYTIDALLPDSFGPDNVTG